MKMGPDDVLGENLEQAARLVPVHEDLVPLNLGAVLRHSRHPVEDLGVVVIIDVEEGHGRALHRVERGHQVVGRQGQMLDALPLVLTQVLLNLRIALRPRIAAVEDGATIETLNRLGAEGWRVVSARRALDSGRGLYEVILMKK